MAAKKSATGPLTRALDAETPVSRKRTSRGDVTERPTPRAQPVGEVLENLQAQAKDAMPGSFFDEGATTKTTPVTKRVRSEAGTVEVSAKRRDPNVQASVAIDVRCDQDEKSDAGCYQVHAEGHVGRKSKEGLIEAEFPVEVQVRDADGGLKLDSEEMRNEIAKAIRSTGAVRSRSRDEPR
jgi:hypothetical protein